MISAHKKYFRRFLCFCWNWAEVVFKFVCSSRCIIEKQRKQSPKSVAAERHFDSTGCIRHFRSALLALQTFVSDRTAWCEEIFIDMFPESYQSAIQPVIDSKHSNRNDSLTQIKTLQLEIYVDSKIGKYYCFHPRKGIRRWFYFIVSVTEHSLGVKGKTNGRREFSARQMEFKWNSMRDFDSTSKKCSQNASESYSK